MRKRKAFGMILTSCMMINLLSGCSASSSLNSSNTTEADEASKNTETDIASESSSGKVVEIDIDTSEAPTESSSEPEETEEISTLPTEESSSEGQTEIDINGYSQKELASLYDVELEEGQGIITWSAAYSAVVVTPLDGMEIFTMGDMTNNLYMCNDEIQINIYTIDDTYDLSYFNSLYDNGVMIDDNRLLVEKGDTEAEFYYYDDFVTITISVSASSPEVLEKYASGGMAEFMDVILDNCSVVPRK